MPGMKAVALALAVLAACGPAAFAVTTSEEAPSSGSLTSSTEESGTSTSGETGTVTSTEASSDATSTTDGSTSTTDSTESTDTTSSGDTTTANNDNCPDTTFIIQFTITGTGSMTDAEFKQLLADALDTEPECITLRVNSRRLEEGDARRLTRDTDVEASTDKTEDQVNNIVGSTSFSNVVCTAAGGSSDCSVTGEVIGSNVTTTTTSEMPWGLPWWAWFLICCGILLLCLICFTPLCGAPLAMGGKKSKASATTTETVYEVVDEPDTEVPMATSVVPMATASVPTTAYPSSAVPMATAAVPMGSYAATAPLMTTY